MAAMALFSSSSSLLTSTKLNKPSSSTNLIFTKPVPLPQKRAFFSLSLTRSIDNGSSTTVTSTVVGGEVKNEEAVAESDITINSSASGVVAVEEKKKKVEEVVSSNGALKLELTAQAPIFKDPRWVGGTWDLKQFQNDGRTDWDAVIDAEARRRKWLEENPESTNNEEPVLFDTSIIPWWAWMKRYHLPEAELLNGRAAMIGFFMAYFVDSLTGLGVVDQMSNIICKTLLFVAVAGVLLIRKNEDVENLKKLLEETTFYDKQWQATWQDDSSSNPKND